LRNKARTYDECHKVINGEIYKLCSDCGKWLPLTNQYFYTNKSSKQDGFNTYCKNCTKKRSSKWIKNNPERYHEIRQGTEQKPRTKLLKRQMDERLRKEGKRKKWQENNKDKLYFYGKDRRMHKTHEISKEEWELCLEYFNHSCAYCGLPEDQAIVIYGQHLHKEHVNPNGSNDLSNNIPSCKSCNSKKHNYTLEEWYKEDNELCGDFSYERLDKINKWLEVDNKLYIMNL
jgi:hypothetical protein